jgi:triosephosphate isomerase
MRNKIVAGNWKMNTTLEEGKALVSEVLNSIEGVDLTHKKVVFGAPFISLNAVAEIVGNRENICVASQNVSSFDKGAYTGEISAEMISASGAKMVIIGHSERRAYFGETNQVLADKVNLTLKNGLMPIYCCGEVLEERKNDSYKEVIKSQIKEGLFHLSKEEFKNIVIAYEPVWAIGTGETASPEQAQEVHAYIRNLIADMYGSQTADSLSILYGGSMKPGNAKDLMSMMDIDGGLIGGAALKASDFVGIISAM